MLARKYTPLLNSDKNKKNIFFNFIIINIYRKIANAEISDSLFMTIGNKPITQSDLVNEIKIILILNNESYSGEKKDHSSRASCKTQQ